MLLAIVERNPKRVNNAILEELAKSLPRSVAQSLSTDSIGGILFPADVEVKVENYGLHDIRSFDLEITVFADLSEERQKNLDFRRDELCKMVEDRLPKQVTGSVGILLVPASFGKLWSQS